MIFHDCGPSLDNQPLQYWMARSNLLKATMLHHWWWSKSQVCQPAESGLWLLCKLSHHVVFIRCFVSFSLYFFAAWLGLGTQKFFIRLRQYNPLVVFGKRFWSGLNHDTLHHKHVEKWCSQVLLSLMQRGPLYSERDPSHYLQKLSASCHWHQRTSCVHLFSPKCPGVRNRLALHMSGYPTECIE